MAIAVYDGLSPDDGMAYACFGFVARMYIGLIDESSRVDAR